MASKFRKMASKFLKILATLLWTWTKIQYAAQIDQLTISSINFTFSWSSDRKWKNQLISQNYNTVCTPNQSANHSEHELHIMMVSWHEMEESAAFSEMTFFQAVQWIFWCYSTSCIWLSVAHNYLRSLSSIKATNLALKIYTLVGQFQSGARLLHDFDVIFLVNSSVRNSELSYSGISLAHSKIYLFEKF